MEAVLQGGPIAVEIEAVQAVLQEIQFLLQDTMTQVRALRMDCAQKKVENFVRSFQKRLEREGSENDSTYHR